MSQNYNTEASALPPKLPERPRGGSRAWIVWVAVVGGILLLVFFKGRTEPQGDILSQYRFEQLVDAGQIVHATIAYDSQSTLNEIVGTYLRPEGGAKAELPFRTRVRLTGGLEEKLLHLPQFEPRQPNAVLINVLYSVLPFVIIAALIWFFFIRQIKKAGGFELQERARQQQERYDAVLAKWEEQTRRMDAILSKLENSK